jgi:hypothetical protein
VGYRYAQMAARRPACATRETDAGQCAFCFFAVVAECVPNQFTHSIMRYAVGDD